MKLDYKPSNTLAVTNGIAPVSDTPIRHVTFVPDMDNTRRQTVCALGNLRLLVVDNGEKL